MHSSDEDLAGAVLTGKQCAVDEFVNNFAPLIHHIIKAILKTFKLTEEDSEDCYQEVLIHVLSNLTKWNPDRGKLSAWIGTVARNKTLYLVRGILGSRNSHIPIDAERSEGQDGSFHPLDYLSSRDSNPEEEIIQTECRSQVRTAIMKLSEKQREVVIRYYYGRQSYREIATALNVCKDTTVAMRLYHAKKVLGKLLKGYFSGE